MVRIMGCDYLDWVFGLFGLLVVGLKDSRCLWTIMS